MRFSIDIGSNSVRLLGEDGIKRSVITKLADGLDATGRLSPDGIARSIAALTDYAALCRGGSVAVFATEAVRKAADGKDFIARVKAETGLSVMLLSPEQEAALALFGAEKPDGAVSVCDLGGGSMELISSSDGSTPEYIKSLPLGVVVLKNRFDGDYRAAIDAAPSLVAEYGAPPKYPLTVSGGSACTIAAALLGLNVYDAKKINGYKITARELDGILPMLMSRKLAVLRPVCARRADTVAYGAIILQALINHIGLDEFTVSDSGNLEAMLKVDISDLGPRS